MRKGKSYKKARKSHGEGRRGNDADDRMKKSSSSSTTQLVVGVDDGPLGEEFTDANVCTSCDIIVPGDTQNPFDGFWNYRFDCVDQLPPGACVGIDNDGFCISTLPEPTDPPAASPSTRESPATPAPVSSPPPTFQPTISPVDEGTTGTDRPVPPSQPTASPEDGTTPGDDPDDPPTSSPTTKGRPTGHDGITTTVTPPPTTPSPPTPTVVESFPPPTPPASRACVNFLDLVKTLIKPTVGFIIFMYAYG